MTVHDPSPAHARGSCHPCQGVSPIQASPGMSVVPVCGTGSLPPRLECLLAARCNFSGVQWSQLREEFGGRRNCFVRREAFRGAATAVANEPGRQDRTDERGAHLVHVATKKARANTPWQH